jgi:hypothetical protein
MPRITVSKGKVQVTPHFQVRLWVGTTATGFSIRWHKKNYTKSKLPRLTITPPSYLPTLP